MTYNPETGTNENQNKAIVLVVCFEVALLGMLAMPIFAEAPSVLDQDGGQVGPMLLVAAVVIGAATAGRKSPFMSGLAAGIVALISIALTLAVSIGVFLAILLDEFSAGVAWGGGAYAVVAAAAFGLIAVVVSGVGWKLASPPSWTPIAVLGAVSVVAMVLGLAVPEEGFTVGDTLGFTAHPLIGFSLTAFLVMLAAVGVAGFALGRWGVGLLAGFLGYIAVGWVTSQSTDQSEAFGWSGVDGSTDFHGLTVIGFWAASGLFVVHAIQQFSVDPSGLVQQTPPSAREEVDNEPPVCGRWASDPFGRYEQRFFDGAQWTKHVMRGSEQLKDEAVPDPPSTIEAGWYGDPLSRFTHRFFDGIAWTDKVANDGIRDVDAPTAGPPGLPMMSSEPGTIHARPGTQPADLERVPSPPEPAPNAAGDSLPSVVPLAGQALDETMQRHGLVPTPGDSFVLTSESGVVHKFVTAVAVGRAPVAPSDHPDALPLPVDDATVSKTHLVIGRTDDEIWVVDLHSSNGTEIESDAGTIKATPGERNAIPSGSRIVIGDSTVFLVERS